VSNVSELPIFATITAKITFQKFEWRDNLPERMFLIPRGYREEAGKFSDF
jgi:hypothetical protein